MKFKVAIFSMIIAIQSLPLHTGALLSCFGRENKAKAPLEEVLFCDNIFVMGAHSDYPQRIPVKMQQQPWAVEHRTYRPSVYPEGCMDNTSIEYPQNPMGRTGLAGKGVFENWGVNRDFIVVVFNHGKTGNIQVLSLRLPGTGSYVLPSGASLGEYRDPSLVVKAAVTMLLGLVPQNPSDMNMLTNNFWEYEYFADSRNTDNAWVEACIVFYEIEIDETEISGFINGLEPRWLDAHQELFLLKHNYAELVRFVSRKTRIMALQGQLSQDLEGLFNDAADEDEGEITPRDAISKKKSPMKSRPIPIPTPRDEVTYIFFHRGLGSSKK